MATLLEAIALKRKMFFEYDNAPYHCLDVDVSKPTARGGQTLVRIKMRNLLTRAVFLELAGLGVERPADQGRDYGVWSQGQFFSLGRLDDET